MKGRWYLFVLFFISFTALAQEGMPIDEETGKVVYRGAIEISGMDQETICDKVGIALSTQTSRMANAGPMYVSTKKDAIYGTFTVITSTKIHMYSVSSVYRIEMSESEVTYEISDMRAISLIPQSLSELMKRTEEGLTPIEEHRSFNVHDFSKMNENAISVHLHIKSFIKNLETHLEE